MLLFLLTLQLLLVGCGDLDPVPPAELQGDEPVANMRFSEDLPSLAGLADRWSGASDLDPIIERWREGWNGDAEWAERIRAEAIHSAVPFLVAEMPDSELDRTIADVGRAMEAVEEAVQDSTPESLAGPLGRAGRAFRDASVAREAGDPEGALAGTLIAADHLRATTPEALSEVLLHRGQEALRRISAHQSYPEVTRRRGERLLVGARDALDGGDPTLALRRAWYAVGLLQTDEEGGQRRPSPPDSEDPGR